MADETAALVEELRHQQRLDWEGGHRFPAEHYLERYSTLRQSPDAVLELIYHEVVLRARAGERPTLDEYAARFPTLTERLAPLFEVHQALEFGSLAAPA